MKRRSERPLAPRHGDTLMVCIVGRISGCQGQKELSLDDQDDHAKQLVAEMYDGDVDWKIITNKAKGEWLDRPELAEIEAILRTRRFDLVVAEDLGRIVRDTDAKRLRGIAVDNGTRVIAPHDYVDKNEPS